MFRTVLSFMSCIEKFGENPTTNILIKAYTSQLGKMTKPACVWNTAREGASHEGLCTNAHPISLSFLDVGISKQVGQIL